MEKEQAFKNIQVAVEKFVGTRAEHVALEQSLVLIAKELGLAETKEPEVVEQD